MARCLPRTGFHGWFGGFLPKLDTSEPATLFMPADVSDRSDGKIAHLDGLNLSRGLVLAKPRSAASGRRGPARR